MASPAINMGRVVRKNSAASFTFQLPQAGLNAGDISFQVNRHDTTGTHPVVSSSVVETSTPGTYMLSVAAADMVDGGVYYAAVGWDTIAFRLPSWSYAPVNEFDKVIADLAALDTHLGNVQTAVQGSITQAVTTLEGDITSAKNAIQSDVTAAKNAIQTDVSNAKTFLDGAITSAKNSLHGDVTGAVTTLQGDIAGAVTTIDANTDSKVAGAVTTLSGNITTAQGLVQADITSAKNSLHGDITQAVTTLEGDITTAKGAIQGDITSAKNAIQTDIGAAKTAIQTDISAAVTTIDNYTLSTVNAAKGAIQTDISNAVTTVNGSITSAKNSIEGLITTETNQIDSAIAVVDGKANAAKVASESLVADFTDGTGRLKNLLDGISAKANAAKIASEAVQGEVGVFDGAFGNLASLLGSASFSSSGKSLFTRLGELDSSVGLLEKEADAATRQAAVVGRFDSVDTQLAGKYTLAQGDADQTAVLGRFSSVDSAISAVKAVLDSSLVENAKLIPNVPTSILSPMAEQIMRVSCNVTGPSGSSLAGALEDPDNQEVGVRLYMADGATGALTEISSTCLFEDAAKATGLPACAGTGTGVPSTFKKMKRDGVGQYHAYVKLEAYKHGNLQWDFQIVDSDPSTTPQIFQTVRFTEVRRQVSFTAFGAF